MTGHSLPIGASPCCRAWTAKKDAKQPTSSSSFNGSQSRLVIQQSGTNIPECHLYHFSSRIARKTSLRSLPCGFENQLVSKIPTGRRNANSSNQNCTGILQPGALRINSQIRMARAATPIFDDVLPASDKTGPIPSHPMEDSRAYIPSHPITARFRSCTQAMISLATTRTKGTAIDFHLSTWHAKPRLGALSRVQARLFLPSPRSELRSSISFVFISSPIVRQPAGWLFVFCARTMTRAIILSWTATGHSRSKCRASS